MLFSCALCFVLTKLRQACKSVLGVLCRESCTRDGHVPGIPVHYGRLQQQQGLCWQCMEAACAHPAVQHQQGEHPNTPFSGIYATSFEDMRAQALLLVPCPT